MTARPLSWAAVVATTIWCAPALAHGEAARADRHDAVASLAVSREHRYQVDARVRPLLFWIRKSDIGDGRLTWRTGPDGRVGYELLVGSDPTRCPRRINRWGYLREESGPGGAMVFGVMSRSDEQSVEDADKNTSRAGEAVHVFKALQQHVTGSQAQITVSDVRAHKDLTYSDLDMLLAAVPGAPAQSRTASVAGATAPGFLAAAASLLEDGRKAAGHGSQAPRLVRVYPYNGTLYEMQLRSAARVNQFTRDGRAFGPAIEAHFRVVHPATGWDTTFTIVYGVDGALTDVPLLISFRPRWFLEIQCVLVDDDARL